MTDTRRWPADPDRRRRLARQSRLVVRFGESIEHGDFGPADLEEMFRRRRERGIRDMETAGVDIHHRRRGAASRRYVDSYYGSSRASSPCPSAARPARGDTTSRRATSGRPHRDTPGRARDRQGVRVPPRPHDAPSSRRPAPGRSRSARGSIRASSTRAWSTSRSASTRSSTRTSRARGRGATSSS